MSACSPRQFGRILSILAIALPALLSCTEDETPVSPEKDPACSVAPAALDFGTVPVGLTSDLSFTIRNTGGGTLDGDVAESCPQFGIVSGGGAFSLGGGDSVVVTVRYAPQDEGAHGCDIATGSAACGAVSCTGEAQFAWEVVYSNAYHGWFDIDGTSASDIWAVGHDLIHFDGSSWTITANPSDKTLYGVWCEAPDNVFAVGKDYFSGDGVIIRYNGANWDIVLDDIAAVGFLGVWGSAWNDIYAVGLGASAYRYDGMSWGSFFIGGVVSHAVWGTASNDVFIVGDTGRIQHYNGAIWEGMSGPVSSALLGVWGSSPSDVFVTSFGSAIMRYNGSTWAETVNNGTGSRMEDVWGVSATDAYCVGYGGRIMRFDGSSWSDMLSPTTQNLTGIWGTSGSNIYAVGDGGAIIRYTGQ